MQNYSNITNNKNNNSLNDQIIVFCHSESVYHQRSLSKDHCFTFTGKERDRETGFSYFGARYYDSDLSGLFLSVDPMSDKYPGISPYAYCAWNPVKLLDPNGDTIFNAHEKYKDVTEIVQRLTKSLEGITGNEKRKIQKKIAFYKGQNEKYKKVQGAIEAFKKNNPGEYDILNNKLSSYGNKVNIIVCASDDYLSSSGSEGETFSSMLQDDVTKKIIGVSNIKVILYGLAFCQGNNGLSTLANEFGDAIFSVVRFQEQYDGYNEITANRDAYWRDISSRFSFKYERYIIDPEHNPKPDVFTFK